MILQMQLIEFNTSYSKKITEETKTSRPPTEMLTIHGNTYLIHTIHTDTYRYIQIHTKYELNFFDCFIWLYDVCIVCIGSKYMHINTHTGFYLIFMYVCVFICMYVYVFFATKPVGESILTHTYIYMHIHTNFQKNTYT